MQLTVYKKFLTIDSVLFLKLDLFNVWVSSDANCLVMGCFPLQISSEPFWRKSNLPGCLLIDGYSPMVTLTGLGFFKLATEETDPLED